MPRHLTPPTGAMNARQAAHYIGVHPTTLWRLEKARAVRSFRPTAQRGRARQGVPVYYFQADLDLYLSSVANRTAA